MPWYSGMHSIRQFVWMNGHIWKMECMTCTQYRLKRQKWKISAYEKFKYEMLKEDTKNGSHVNWIRQRHSGEKFQELWEKYQDGTGHGLIKGQALLKIRKMIAIVVFRKFTKNKCDMLASYLDSSRTEVWLDQWHRIRKLHMYVYMWIF